ncbi:MAG: hypothetical protein A2V88_17655 [Elusimicrobia bacterium RBG_16_66_12]|nr:MAG: hypothetical protein A2V88_17655 [Elusimicrobia bacterium RBG_16_66_12]
MHASAAAGQYYDPTIWTQEVQVAAAPLWRFRQFARDVTDQAPGDKYLVLQKSELEGFGTNGTRVITAGTNIATGSYVLSTVAFAATEHGVGVWVENLVKLCSPYEVDAETRDTLARDMANAIDGFIRLKCFSAGDAVTNIIATGYGNYFCSRGGSITASGTPTATMIYDLVGTGVDYLLSNNVPKVQRDGIGEGYICLCHPRSARGVKKLSNFVSAAQYADAGRLYRGEIGLWEGAYWIETTNVGYNSTGYWSYMFGEGAFGQKIWIEPEIRMDFAPTTANDMGRHGKIVWYGVVDVKNFYQQYVAGLLCTPG